MSAEFAVLHCKAVQMRFSAWHRMMPHGKAAPTALCAVAQGKTAKDAKIAKSKNFAYFAL